jgi:hypothetical protein
MTASVTRHEVGEDRSKLVQLDHGGDPNQTELVLDALRNDSVALVHGVPAEEADAIIHRVASGLGLGEALELQAGFAAFHGHRHGIGKYYMSVNGRADHQFICPHCEGTRFSNIELAAFFCYENTTDGGETILLHIDSQSDAWEALREVVTRGKITGPPLSAGAMARARGLYQLNLPADVLTDEDEVLSEKPSAIDGLTLVEALARTRPCYSHILQRDVRPYWNNIAGVDLDAGRDFADLLKQSGLLREPPGGLQLTKMDGDRKHIRHFGVELSRIFDSRITYKLAPDDFIVLNNMTWSHATSNWSPGSGQRRVAAAFA